MTTESSGSLPAQSQPSNGIEPRAGQNVGFDLHVDFDPNLLTWDDIAMIQSRVLAQLISEAQDVWDEQDAPAGADPSAIPGFPGGGFSKHSKHIDHTKVHSKHGIRSSATPVGTPVPSEPAPGEPSTSEPADGETDTTELPAARPYSKSFSKTGGYSKKIFGKIG
jgi:hypothetical protein